MSSYPIPSLQGVCNLIQINAITLDLKLQLLTSEDVNAILELDLKPVLGVCGLWRATNESWKVPNSDLLGLFSSVSGTKLLEWVAFGPTSYITNLAIHPQYHRQGIGPIIFSFEDCLRSRLERATLEVRVS